MKEHGKNPIKNRTAIVVNDDPIQLAILASLLGKEGLTVHSSRSVAEALATIASLGPPNLIVTDLYMPAMDGWRFCRLLRSPEYRELNHTPILVVSATYSSQEAQEITIQSGADAFLPAPLNVNQLHNQVRALLEGNTAPQAATVLIIDADPALVTKLAKVFEAENYQVIRAHTGEQGRLLLRTYSPNLVLIDYHLPDIPGDELLREFRRVPLAPIVIMMTQDPTPALATQLLGQGAAAYLQKPFEPEFVVRLCQTAIREQALLSIEVRLEERSRELRESEARYRTLFKAMGSGFGLFEVIWSPTGKPADYRFLEVNPAFEILTGFTRESLIGKTLWELFPSSDSTRNERLADVALSAKPAHLEMHLPGLNKIFDVAAFSPKPGQIAATFHDISRRKEAEAKIKEQAALLDKAHDAIWVVDLRDRLVYVNPSAIQLFDWSPPPVRGEPIQDRLPATALAKFAEIRETVLREGQWSGDWNLTLKPERHLFLHSRWTLVRQADGQPQSLLVSISDLTRQKELEKKYLHIQRIDGIVKLVGGLAHDLNNILSPILIALPLLRHRITDAPSHSLLDNIESSVLRGAGVIRDLLAFGSRVEGQRATLATERLLRDLAQTLGATFPKSIIVEILLPASLRSIKGDAALLRQALLNLCLNAREAMPQGGKLVIEGQNIDLDEAFVRLNPEAKPGPWVVIAVSDTGAGISTEIQERIFDPFFTTKPSGTASGLGLSTSLGLVKSHGGFIQVWSQPGQGSQFKVFLPADLSPVPEVMPPPPVAPVWSVPTGSGEWILLVEDELAIQQVLRTSLEESGYRVILANHGGEALELYKKHQAAIAVVITDMIMPHLDGAQTISALRQMSAALPIIAISGMMDNTPDVEAALGLVQAFLAKPFLQEKLLTTLQTVLASGTAKNPTPNSSVQLRINFQPPNHHDRHS